MFPLYRPDHNTQRKEAGDQFTWRTGFRLTKETMIPPNKAQPLLSVEENLTSAMAFAFEAIPFCLLKLKEIKYIKIFILPKLLFLGSQLQD